MLRQDAESLVRELLAAFPLAAVRPETEELYVRYISELDREAVRRAAERLVRRSPSLPTIAEIRRELAEEQFGLPSPAEAYYSLFDRGARSCPLARYVALLMGGEYNVRTSEAPAATRAQFLRLYQEHRDEVVRTGQLPKAVQALAAQVTAAGPASAEETSWEAEASQLFDDLSELERERLFTEAADSLASAYGLRSTEAGKFTLPPPMVRGEAIRRLAVEQGLLNSPAVTDTAVA